jgi:tryptophan-rich sensory protein
MHRPGWALAVMSLWLLVVFIVIVTFRSIKPQASNLMLPVVGWLLFLWVLNLVQWHLNGGALASFF